MYKSSVTSRITMFLRPPSDATHPGKAAFLKKLSSENMQEKVNPDAASRIKADRCEPWERAIGAQIVSTVQSSYSRPIPLLAIVLVALAVHGPLLAMQLPAGSFDANFHMFFASHYAHHWFNPWNEKWFAGFSQTTYPPLTHQWIALLSNVVGLKMGYMLVQLIGVLLLPVGVYRFARIWVEDRAASYAALGSIFLGALAFLVYQAGQLATVTSAALYLNALPYFYEWSTESSGRALIKGIAVSLAAAAAHHVTLIFGTVLFAGPVLWVACLDAHHGRERGSVAAVFSRAILFAALVGIGVGIVLLPYWMTLLQHPI